MRRRLVKYVFVILFLATSLAANAQNVVGIVTDKVTTEPLIGATVTYGKLAMQTNRNGLFEFDGVKLNDTLKVTVVGYLPYTVLIMAGNTSQHIEMTKKVNELKPVNIIGTKSFTQDSLNNRLDYAKSFNYQHPKLSDAITLNPGTRPGELLTIDLLAIVRALTYKTTDEYKFNKLLKRDEHEQYVDEKFNRGIVERVTGLKGDTLSAFLAEYRPTYAFVLKSTPYDMQTYIKDCCKKFEEGGFKIDEAMIRKE
jgi:hypothetical protein